MTDAKYHVAETAVDMQRQPEPYEEPWTCQYVLSILVSIFCFSLPCSFIGLIHLIAARGDYVRGYNRLAQKKKSQATAWTVAGFVIGLVFIILYIIAIVYAIGAVAKQTQSSNSFSGSYSFSG